MMNLSMIGALGKMAEWETHCQGAINNGVNRAEVQTIVHVIGIYCDVLRALECFRFHQLRQFGAQRGEDLFANITLCGFSRLETLRRFNQ